MKKIVNIVKRAGIAMLVVGLVFNITSCGSKTLEDIVKEDENIKEQIESMAVGGLEVAVKDNQIIYSYTYDQTFDKESLEAIKPEIKEIMSRTDEIYQSMIKQVKDATKLDEVSIKIVYNNGDGNPIYENEYK